MDVLPYRNLRDAPEGRKASLAWPIAAISLLVLLEWALFELQRMPYRPPVDMSTLLGGGEIFVVRLLMAAIVVPLGISILWLIRNVRLRRRES